MLVIVKSTEDESIYFDINTLLGVYLSREDPNLVVFCFRNSDRQNVKCLSPQLAKETLYFTVNRLHAAVRDKEEVAMIAVEGRFGC